MDTAILILLLITLTSCTSKINSESQDATSEIINHISNIAENGKWMDIADVKHDYGFYLSNKGDIYGLYIDANDSFPIDSYIESLSPMPYAEVKSFKICVNDDDEPYAKDNNRVYYAYINGILFEDGENMCAELYRGDLSIRGADPMTFKYLGQGYAIDKKNIYFQGFVVQSADLQTFKVLGKGYAVDKNNMYSRGNKIKWNDHIIGTLQQPDRESPHSGG